MTHNPKCMCKKRNICYWTTSADASPAQTETYSHVKSQSFQGYNTHCKSKTMDTNTKDEDDRSHQAKEK